MNDPLYLIAAVTPYLAMLCWWDCRYRRLPDVLTLGAAVVGLAWRCGSGGMSDFLSGMAGGLVCGLFLLLPFYLGGAGGGDVKMLFSSGCILGLGRCGMFLFLTSVSGLCLMVLMLLFRAADGRRLKHWLRCLFDWRYDRAAGRAALPSKSDERARVPFGVAIALGMWLTLALEVWQR